MGQYQIDQDPHYKSIIKIKGRVGERLFGEIIDKIPHI